MKKRELLIVGAVLLVLTGAVAVWMYQSRTTTSVGGYGTDSGTVEEPTACASDRMQCANGEYVTRTLPDCRFICPDVSAAPIVANNSGTLQIKIGETGKPSSRSTLQIIPMGILEDSRCPVDVQCIQAGTVRLRANVLISNKPSTADFKLGEPVVVGGETITLIEVTPEKDTRRPTTYSDYKFTFRIK